MLTTNTCHAYLGNEPFSGSLAKNIWCITNVLWILEANKIIGRNRVLKKKLGFNKP